jgi:hypothetical protein
VSGAEILPSVWYTPPVTLQLSVSNGSPLLEYMCLSSKPPTRAVKVPQSIAEKKGEQIGYGVERVMVGRCSPASGPDTRVALHHPDWRRLSVNLPCMPNPDVKVPLFVAVYELPAYTMFMVICEPTRVPVKLKSGFVPVPVIRPVCESKVAMVMTCGNSSQHGTSRCARSL